MISRQTIVGQKCALLIVGGFRLVLSFMVWFSSFLSIIILKNSSIPSSAFLKKSWPLKPSCYRRNKKKRNELRKKKIDKYFTSKRPSTGLNVKPFFTVSAVSSSWTKKISNSCFQKDRIITSRCFGSCKNTSGNPKRVRRVARAIASLWNNQENEKRKTKQNNKMLCQSFEINQS